MNQPSLIISTDVVPFRIGDGRLETLLVGQDNDCWRLPGGDMDEGEDLDTAALRHLHEQTGLRDVYLEQLYTFGHPDRVQRQRLVSVAYFALVRERQSADNSTVNPGTGWFPLAALPPLQLDHAEVMAMAHKRLAAKLAYSTIALQFMPERFTLRALQTVYETILDMTLDKRNFRKRLSALGCIEPTGELDHHGNHRPAKLYRARMPGQVEFIK